MNSGDMTDLEKLVKSKEALEARLLNEKSNLNSVATKISWCAGMRRTGSTPSFRFEKELNLRIAAVENQIKQLSGLMSLSTSPSAPSSLS